MSEPLVAERRLAVVGAGPRGVMLLERILARLEGAAPDAHPRRLRIDVVDPYPPGPGRVWRTDQSELYLMNTPAFFPTACAADNPGLRPSTAAQTFDQWRRVHPEASLGVRRHQYPARAVYGRYLRHLYKDVVAGLRARPEVVEVVEHRAEATALHPRPDGGARLELRDADGAVSALDADAVVLCLGHQPAELSPGQNRMAAAARGRDELHYQGPQIPSDVDWETVEAGADVLVRGMGLNAFDLLAQLTQGRGGVYRRTGDGPGRALRYEPSGDEPRLHLMSRRGIPYLPKAEVTPSCPAASPSATSPTPPWTPSPPGTGPWTSPSTSGRCCTATWSGTTTPRSSGPSPRSSAAPSRRADSSGSSSASSRRPAAAPP